jgi:GNAT superfamily N-acetyltransferase
MFSLEPVAHEDFEAMLALRIDALRESLERLGRFDLQRARERLASQFDPPAMRHIARQARGGLAFGLTPALIGDRAERIGYVTIRPVDDALRVEHLYIRPGAQGQGAGAWAIEQAKMQARAQRRDLTLAALKLSDANRFYRRHGFQPVSEREFDIEYRWQCGGTT